MLVNRAFASSPSLMRGWNCSIGKISDTTTLADIFLLAFLAATMSTTKRVPSVDAVATLTSGIWDSFSARQDRIGRSASMSPATLSCMITSVLLVASAGAQNVSNPNARITGTIAVKYPLIAGIIRPLHSSVWASTPYVFTFQSCSCPVLPLHHSHVIWLTRAREVSSLCGLHVQLLVRIGTPDSYGDACSLALRDGVRVDATSTVRIPLSSSATLSYC